MAAVLLFAAAACGNVPEDNKAPQNNAANNTANNNAPADSEVTAPADKSITLNGQEVSPRTVLITVSDDFTEEDDFCFSELNDASFSLLLDFPNFSLELDRFASL